jgi:hypothetical protein
VRNIAAHDHPRDRRHRFRIVGEAGIECPRTLILL